MSPEPVPSPRVDPASPGEHPFFQNGGELGALCRAKDWSQTPLGPPEAWPQSLKSVVSLVLGSSFPSIILWGPELIQIYNDTYRLLMGTKHPAGLGMGNRECWPEAWPINKDIYPRIFAGETVSFQEALYPLAPNGYLEDYYLTLCYGPVRDETGRVGGVFVNVFDVTAEVRARGERDRAVAELSVERERLYDVFMQAPASIAVVEGADHHFTVANGRYLELVGDRPLLGRTVAEALPEVVEQGFIQLLDGVRASGEALVASEARILLDRKGTGTPEELFLDFVYQPLKDASGQVFGVMAHAVEITTRVLARRAMEALAAERKAMLGHITDGVVTFDPTGRITFFNAAAGRIYPGLEAERTIVPQRDRVILERVDGSFFPNEDLPSSRALRGELVRDEEWFTRHPDGRRIRVQGSAAPVLDEGGTLIGAVLTVRDVTAQHALLAQLQFERNRLQEIFLQAPAAVMVTRGPDHVIEVANQHYGAITGHRPLIGLALRQAFPDLEGQGLFELYDEVFRTRTPSIGTEVQVRVARFGRVDVAWFNFAYQPLLGADGSAWGVMTHAVEVTDMVHARKIAEDRAKELLRTTRALEQSNRELDQFAYVASHDLKAPLRGIANLSQWLEDDLGPALPESAGQQLNLLRGRVHRMEALIDGILAVARAGRGREEEADVDSGAMVREAVELLAPPAHLRVEISPDLPRVTADRTRLQQVLINLLGNAIKFSAAARPDPVVRVWSVDNGEDIEFFVQDNGPGIEPCFHERIWGIFQTLQRRDAVEGTGIGLSVVKKIVTGRGGRVGLDSEAGEGATFRFTWPRAAAEEPGGLPTS